VRKRKGGKKGKRKRWRSRGSTLGSGGKGKREEKGERKGEGGGKEGNKDRATRGTSLIFSEEWGSRNKGEKKEKEKKEKEKDRKAWTGYAPRGSSPSFLYSGREGAQLTEREKKKRREGENTWGDVSLRHMKGVESGKREKKGRGDEKGKHLARFFLL